MKKLLMGCLILFCLQNGYADLHDPTLPVNYKSEKTGDSVNVGSFELGLTLVSPDRKVAVINGRPLQMGDEVSGTHIVAIDSNSVRLAGPSGNITLFLVDKPVKQESQKNL